MPLFSIPNFRAALKARGHSAFGVIVRFGGVGEPDPGGGGETTPACLFRRFAHFWSDPREAEHRCYFDACPAVEFETYMLAWLTC